VDSLPEVNIQRRDKVWQARSKLIHLAIWVCPDLIHSVPVLGRYVHNPGEKLWNAYSRIAKYLIKIRDFRLAFGTPDIEKMDLELYGHSIPIGVALLITESLQMPVFSCHTAQQSVGK